MLILTTNQSIKKLNERDNEAMIRTTINLPFSFLMLLYFLSSIFSCSPSRDRVMESPEGKMQVSLTEGGTYVVYDRDTIIASTVIGLSLNGKENFLTAPSVALQKIQVDETWSTVIGKNQKVRNYYNEYTLPVEGDIPYQVIFRLYEDGLAWRYVFKDTAEEDSLVSLKEVSSISFSKSFTYWAFNGEKHNIGPLNSDNATRDSLDIPLIVQNNRDVFVAIHEADIHNMAPLHLSVDQNRISIESQSTIGGGDVNTSWRAIMFGKSAGELLESNLLVNLNEPCKIADPSWVKPGKSLWDWRVSGYKTADGYEYGLNTKSHKRFIDFASANNIQYLLIDADWYGAEFSETSDPTAAREGIDIEECMAYAKKKNVGVILYLNDVGARKFGLERVLSQFADWGAAGVKYGFMTGSPEEKVKNTRHIVEMCAKYHLMIDFHDNPIPPSGDERTWPNLITREYGHAQADARYSYQPETGVNTAIINQIAGPIDMTNGWFDLNNAHSRTKVFEEIPGTVTAEVAKLITVYTGLMVLPDSPEEYLKKDELFDCIRKMPPLFDSFQVLNSVLDSTITVARKDGDNWFVGSLTNREPRSLKIKLHFLEPNKQYRATIYSDSPDTHFLNNKEAYQIENNVSVNAQSEINATLAPGGGHAIYIEMIKN